MERIIRIGSRASPLALYQAEEIKKKLLLNGYKSIIIPINSIGDNNLITPIYKFGITGIFTKELDTALLNDKIDIAVHSLKDIPTILPENIFISAVLKRDYPYDVNF